MKTKVLFADDDLTLGCTMAMALEEEGYDLHYQSSLLGLESIILKWKPDVIVLDVEFGCNNGIDAAAQIRRITPHIPIIFESSHVESEYMKKAIQHGGKVYLKKPFNTEELIAYIEAFTKKENDQDVHIASMTINWEKHQLSFPNEPDIKLTPMETKFLQYLVANVNRIVMREEIVKALWEEKDPSSSEQSINNYVVRLRRYLHAESRISLDNIPKKGYKLTIPQDLL